MNTFVFENHRFSLTIGEDAEAKSLYSKCDGVECLAEGLRLPLFSVTEECLAQWLKSAVVEREDNI